MKSLLTCVSLLILSVALTSSGADSLLDGLGMDSEVVKQEADYTCLPKPPPPRPAQHSGAEGFAPLPLPVVPLRRTEKKNPPRPPTLIAKIATSQRSDWATNPGDTENLLRWMAKNLKVNFTAINLPQDKVPANPQEIPILYRTGHDAFSFPPEVRAKLRAYLMNGGTLVFDACCGRRAFAESAYHEIQELIPERTPYRLTMDHPLYHAFFDIKPEDLQFREWALKAGASNGQPAAIGIDVECRTAVFFFRWDVSCGWDGLEDSDRHHCLGYTTATARMLGANLMAYITAERKAAMPLSKALEFVDENKSRAGKFVIAQARYHGLWKTREAGLSMLLNSFHEQTQVPVHFDRQEVSLDSTRLFDVPFVYLSGHQDFSLSDQERTNLREHIRRGGTLLAESCCGREAFDQAFRRELKAVFPELELEPLPATHPLFLYPNQIDSVQPRPALMRRLDIENRIPPHLLGLTVNGRLGVIYSPYGLACGWELADCPYCVGISAQDALALGVNILSYIIMQ